MVHPTKKPKEWRSNPTGDNKPKAAFRRVNTLLPESIFIALSKRAIDHNRTKRHQLAADLMAYYKQEGDL